MPNPFGKIASVLATIAPTLASALGGPLAGMATSAIVQAVTGKPGTDTQTVQQVQEQIATANNPELLLALKKADQDFALSMQQAQIDIEKVNQLDRASAREREVAVKDSTPRNLAYLAVVCFWVFAATGTIVYFHPTISDQRLALLAGFIGTVLGYAISEVKQVFTYYFGSSAGSAAKTDLLAKAPAISE